eukprot:305619-Rhodomonas_salina.1
MRMAPGVSPHVTLGRMGPLSLRTRRRQGAVAYRRRRQSSPPAVTRPHRRLSTRAQNGWGRLMCRRIPPWSGTVHLLLLPTPSCGTSCTRAC